MHVHRVVGGASLVDGSLLHVHRQQRVTMSHGLHLKCCMRKRVTDDRVMCLCLLQVRAFAATRLDDYPEEGEGHEADRDTARTNKSSVDDDGAQSSGRSLLSCLLTDGLAGNPNAGMSFASMRSLNRSQNLSRSLGDLVDLKSGTLTAGAVCRG